MGEVYLPGNPVPEGEELVHDDSAYVMLHELRLGAPCLSFDIISHDMTSTEDASARKVLIAAGTQASRAHVNSLAIAQISNLDQTRDDNSSDSDASENNEQKSKLECALVPHNGCVNRVRSKNLGGSYCAATWSESGSVEIWKLDDVINSLQEPMQKKRGAVSSYEFKLNPMYTYRGHQQEGFAVDWSRVAEGVLATGDCKRDIHIWQPAEGGTWNVDQRPLVGHVASVEDLQWSPNEKSVLASCSVDKSIRIWDCRAPPTKACMLECADAHDQDVNVISWNLKEPLLASGGDDGILKVWDLRQFHTKKPVVSFKHHTNCITTVEWHPSDSTVFASGGADDQIALWDLSIEADSNEMETDEASDEKLTNLPPQLLFIHQGQQHIKELHWHSQLPGVIISTAHSGFNIFQTISV